MSALVPENEPYLTRPLDGVLVLLGAPSWGQADDGGDEEGKCKGGKDDGCTPLILDRRIGMDQSFKAHFEGCCLEIGPRPTCGVHLDGKS